MARPASRRYTSSGGGLGTFAGVFTPSVLTILGIILFLRVGYVVGSAGLGRTLLIIGLANLISVLTSVSLATIATNLRVKGGGDYYLISRTLGVEFGGALGAVLFAAQSISVAFYAIGFAEAATVIAGVELWWFSRAVAGTAVLGLFVLAFVGADAATRFQFVVMGVLVLALAGFFAGGIADFDTGQLRANWTPGSDQSFWILFAIFFPAVTGFTQGVSMSGDLADPSRSLPRGTFLAVGVSIVVYLATAVVFAGALPGAELAGDTGAMRRVAAVPWLVDAGVIAATLSSALASFLGAPRILQSLARDRVFGVLDPFAAGHGPDENPRRGVLLSLVIALATVALGNLNVIAPLVSMFFLVSYGLLNFATYYEARAKSPSFRPTFRWGDPRLSLAGALVCGATMIAIDPAAGAVAGAILFGILQYVRRTVHVSRWADSSRSARLMRLREGLLELSSRPEHPRDWRPVIVAFSEESPRRVALLRFASWIDGGSGFVSVVQVLDEPGRAASFSRREDCEQHLREDVRRAGVRAFARCVAAPSGARALSTLLGAHGIGEIRANTVLVNRLEGDASEIDDERRATFARQLRTALRSGCNLVVLDADPEEVEALDDTPVDRRRIDVWFERDATGRLSLLLAYLMTRLDDWKDAEIRLIAASDGERREPLREQLDAMLDEVRIRAEVTIVDDTEPPTVVSASRDASVVFLPFVLRRDRTLGPGDRPLDTAGAGLPVVAFAMAAHDLELDAEPEEGQAGEDAAVLDRAREAEDTARKAQQEAERAEEGASAARDRSGPEDGDEIRDAEARAERARRRAVRAETAARVAREAASEIEQKREGPEDRDADQPK